MSECTSVCLCVTRLSPSCHSVSRPLGGDAGGSVTSAVAAEGAHATGVLDGRGSERVGPTLTHLCVFDGRGTTSLSSAGQLWKGVAGSVAGVGQEWVGRGCMFEHREYIHTSPLI